MANKSLNKRVGYDYVVYHGRLQYVMEYFSGDF
jgi:hypothetical protein